MKKVVDDLRLMIRVCDLYYNQNMSQQEIASLLNLSRPTLSRLLARAKEQKLIRIEVAHVDFVKYWELSEKLKTKFQLKDVLISDSHEQSDDTKKAIGQLAAPYLQQLIQDGDTIGISMGSTLSQVVENLKECHDTTITVFPLVGGVGQARMELHSNTLAEKLAQCYFCLSQPMVVPARVFSQVVKNELMKDMSVAAMKQFVARMRIAVLGIGYPNEESSIKATGYFAENEMEMLVNKGVAGEINMQFYDINGDTSSFKDNNYVIGTDVQKLKKVPISIGIAGGRDKAAAILGAIRGGYINTLITDYNCAEALLHII